MQLYKPLLLFLLAILTIIVFYNSSLLSITANCPILNFDLSVRIVLISFLLGAFLIVLPAQNLTLTEMLFFTFYTASSLGAILSKQMTLVVVFCELMSISSFFIIASGGKDSGHAIRYACTHFFIGMLLIIGLSIQNTNLIIIGLLMNCACFPFSFWVVDAYPAASLHGASYLSLFTTKVSFLVMLLHTYNLWQNYTEILAILGAITAIYSIVFAALEQNIRRFLGYSVVGQMGILIMTGSLLSHSENAVPLLMLNIIFSITYQLLLFAVVNSIISRTKAVNFNGVGKFLSVESMCTAIAILTMAAFPGTAGFISKSCITSEIKMASAELTIYKNLLKILYPLFYSSLGLKFFYYMFVSKNRSKSPVAHGSNLPMIILALVCVVAGNPYLFIYNKSLIFDLVYNKQNIWYQFNLLFCTTLLFIPLHKLFSPRINFKMDVDWIFRAFVPYITSLLNRLILTMKDRFISMMQSLTNLLTSSYFNNIDKFKEVFGYNSVAFVSATSLVLITVLLVLLCLNH